MLGKLSKYFFFCLTKLPFNPFAKNTFGIKRQGALGDVLLITPIIQELKKRHPACRIWVETSCPEALTNHPDVQVVIAKGIEKKVSRIINLDLAYEKQPHLHLVDAYSQVALGSYLEDKRPFLFSSDKDLNKLSKIVQGRIEMTKEPYIVMHQAVSWDNRTWPKSCWDVVVKSLIDQGYKIVIVGRKKDFSFEGDTRVINLLSKLTLSQIRELIKHAKLFIGPDSALIHIAMTTSTPIVGIFTVADPKLRVTREKNTIALTPTSSCRFCLHQQKPPVTKVECRFGTSHCIQEITPQMVLQSAKHQLRSS